MSEHSGSSGQLDLSRRGAELEKMFDSIINKIPDLSPPLSYRLAGEDDFFNRTKDLKLVPFERDQIFSAVTHNCNQPDDDEPQEAEICVSKYPRASSSCEYRDKPCREDAEELRSKSSIGFYTGPSSSKKFVNRHWQCSRCTTPSPTPSAYRSDVERKELYETRRRLNKHYSGIKIKHRAPSGVNESNYDCLYSDWFPDRYPYANPMPRSMVADEKVDNLRNIIESANEVEWKMLTPVRPSNEYEEKFFDKLIALHQSRYQLMRSELMSGGCAKPAFKHKRHKLLIRYDGAVVDAVGFKRSNRRQCVRCVGDDSATVCAGVKWRRRMRMFKRHQQRQSMMASAPSVPVLTLTLADQTGSNQTPIIWAADESSSSSGSAADDCREEHRAAADKGSDLEGRRVNLLTSGGGGSRCSSASGGARQSQPSDTDSASADASNQDFERRVQDMLSSLMSTVGLDEPS